MDRSAPHPRHMRILQRVEARQTAEWRDLLHSGRSPHPDRRLETPQHRQAA